MRVRISFKPPLSLNGLVDFSRRNDTFLHQAVG
jgi:hypothetical protein